MDILLHTETPDGRCLFSLRVPFYEAMKLGGRAEEEVKAGLASKGYRMLNWESCVVHSPTFEGYEVHGFAQKEST
jgi:hypothetical protein